MDAANQAVADGRSLETIVREMLDLGGTVFQHGSSKATVDAVAAEVDRMIATVTESTAKDLPKAIGEHVDAFAKLLEQHFDGSNAGSVQQQLGDAVRTASADQHRRLAAALLEESGPLGMLKADLTAKVMMFAERQDALLKELASVKDTLSTRELLQEERDRGTAKGLDYEEAVARVVERSSAPYEDTVLDVSTELGADGNKCGDLVSVLGSNVAGGREVRIVVEAKSRSLGLKASLQQLDRAMSNREADGGILVFSSTDEAPLKGQSFRLYPANRLICVHELDGAGPLPLEVAVSLARTLTLSKVESDNPSADIKGIDTDMTRLNEILEEARCIKRGANAARKGIDQVDSGYERLRTDALAVVANVRGRLM